MAQVKKSFFPGSGLSFFKTIGQAFGLSIVGGGVWSLFTSGEAIDMGRGHKIATSLSTYIVKKDTVAGKMRKFKDTIAFSPLEKYEAQSADSLFNILYTRARFNGSALIAHNGKILYQHLFGYSDFKTKEVLTDTSAFQLGSVSKQFTAVAIMMLKEKGLLDYDDAVAKYFPDFPYKGVTIRMCLDHRSGLPNYMFTCCAETRDQATLIDNTQMMDMLAKYQPRCYFKPNHLYNYCNTNYAVLAAIVENISGVRFAEYMQKNVFEPLHMTHTFIFDKHDTAIPNKVTGYNAGYRRAGTDFLDGVAGDKGVYSTVTDLLKWDQALYGNQLVSQATLKEAYTPHTRWMGGKSYGFGWHLLLYAGDTIIYHGGWWHGFNCNFIRDVKKGNTIIVLSNHINWSINQCCNLIGLFRKTSLNDMPDADKEEEGGGM